MVALRCHACGTVLLPETKFCRRCGVEIAASPIDNSERPTALLGTIDRATTRQLHSRPTGPATTAKPVSNRRKVLIAALVIVVGIALAIAIGLTRNKTPDNNQLIYPGAQTVLNMSHDDGGRTIHLRTSDSLDQVENWYQRNLKLTKTTRLTSHSYVLRNDDLNITLVTEDNATNILIKQSP